MTQAAAPLVIAGLAGLTTSLLVLGLIRGNARGGSAAARLRLTHLLVEDEVDPLTRSFLQRAMGPVVAAMLRATRRVMPSRILESINELLEVAGRPVSTNRFLTLWFIAGLCVPLASALLVVASSSKPGAVPVVVLFGGMGVGLYLPWTWVRRRAQRRRKLTERDLPDAIDLIITNVEAGLGMQAALLMVSQKYAGPVGEAFGRVVRDVSVGGDRTEALASMARRSGVPGMRLFARAIAQAEQTGIPVARVLRNHSAEIREKRQQHAREQAAKIPVKITIPTVLVMFPTVFMLILGPVAIGLMERFQK